MLLPSTIRALFSGTGLVATIIFASSLLSPISASVTFQQAPSTNLDLSQLGRIAYIGDFDAASLYQYTSQSENGLRTNSSHDLLGRYPSTGAFGTVESSDGAIKTMCTVSENGQETAVIVGGNFTSLGGVHSAGVALYNYTTSNITAISGLSGSVNTLYCDPSGPVYIGGMFSVDNTNATNLVSWSPSTGFLELPFRGFDGSVTSITKDATGNLIFGGWFDGLASDTSSTSVRNNTQMIPLAAGSLSYGASSTEAGFDTPLNLICNNLTDSAGYSWLLPANTPSFVRLEFNYGFNPTLLRIANTDNNNQGTKNWTFTALPSEGLLEFYYYNSNGQREFCSNTCPLAQNTSIQEFYFVRPVGINGFVLSITDWYGSGGGLSSVALYQNDIYSFAVEEYNEPACPGVYNPAKVSSSGDWNTVQNSSGSAFPYLIASNANTDTTVTFQPDIPQNGNYSVIVFTPGCLQDNSCASRGQVNLTGTLTSSGARSFQTTIFQTNNYDKYDQIFVGEIDATSGSFRPSVTLSPMEGQSGPITVVAQRVRFDLISSTGGLNGLYEWAPNTASFNLEFSRSIVDNSGADLNSGATINSMVSTNSSTYIGGTFQSSTYSNFFQLSPAGNSAVDGGLNGEVNTMYYDSNFTIYAGGAFNATAAAGGPQGLNGIAALNTNENTWNSLGAGVNGIIEYIVPFQINLTAGATTTPAIALSGSFSQINSFSGFPAISVNSFAVWIPSQNNWLQNLNVPTIYVDGILTSAASPRDMPPLYGGSVFSFTLDASQAVLLSTPSSLQSFPVRFDAQTGNNSGNQKRQASNGTETNTAGLSGASSTGVYAGLFSDENSLNITVLAGHFEATTENNTVISNLVVLNGTLPHGLPTGIDTNSTFTSVGLVDNYLFAGGNLTGNIPGGPVSGLVVYDIFTSDWASTQPAGLTTLNGQPVTVDHIEPQPDSNNVYIAGTFAGAGSLSCPSLCDYNTETRQWLLPATGFNGSIADMQWIDSTKLLIAGNLSINGSDTKLSVYDSERKYYSAAVSNGSPNGEITSVTSGNEDGSIAWVAGIDSSNNAFLTRYNGSTWSYVDGLGAGSSISSLQIFTVSSPHGATLLLDNDHVLLVMGSIVLESYGTVAAAVFNGSAMVPYLLTTSSDRTPGSISGIIVSNPQSFFSSSSKHLAVGFVVLIALAVSCGFIFILIAICFLLAFARKRKLGYRVAPSTPTGGSMSENLRRAPPEELFGGLGNASGNTSSGRSWTTAQNQ